MNSLRDSQTTLLGKFPTIQAAEIAAGMLRSNGIPCEVTNQTIASVLPMTDTWTPLQLLVPSAYASRARALLSSHLDSND
ncbi:MAG: DUF2007 domain-containing protein [Muribaculaceae bacterium]|nr:DUF2007 domain-containing protein [Muribaculaceae bacterium]